LFILAHRELADIYKQKNDRANAELYAGKFAAFWKNADAGLLADKKY